MADTETEVSVGHAVSEDNNEAIEQPEIKEEVEVKPEAESEDKKEFDPEDRPVSNYQKLRQRAQAAEKEKQELERQLQAAEDEKNLLLLTQPAVGQEAETGPPKMPDYDDYLDTAEFNAAMSEWNQKNTEYILKQANEATDSRLDDRLSSREEREAQEKAQLEYERTISSHYDRADKLGAKDFVEREDQLKEWLGHEEGQQSLWTYVLDVYPEDSEKITYDLGDNREKVMEILEAAAKHPGRAATLLDRYVVDLVNRVKPSGNDELLNADEPIELGGGGGSTIDAQLNKLLEQKRKGKMNQNDYMDKKRAILGRKKQPLNRKGT